MALRHAAHKQSYHLIEKHAKKKKEKCSSGTCLCRVIELLCFSCCCAWRGLHLSEFYQLREQPNFEPQSRWTVKSSVPRPALPSWQKRWQRLSTMLPRPFPSFSTPRVYQREVRRSHCLGKGQKKGVCLLSWIMLTDPLCAARCCAAQI